jgi:hypothetical protein
MTTQQQTLDLCSAVIEYHSARLNEAIPNTSLNTVVHKAYELRERIAAEKNLLSEVENAMERWHLGRDNDEDTLHEITEVLFQGGYLQMFKPKKENDNGN